MIVARLLAFVIVIAAVIDPAVTTRHAVKPIIAVVSSDRRHAELAERVAKDLGEEHLVIRAPMSAANATVLVGDAVPATTPGGRVFALLPAPRPVTIRELQSPERAALQGRVVVSAQFELQENARGTMAVSLLANGVVVDQETMAVSGERSLKAQLDYVPARMGSALLEVRARLNGSESAAQQLIQIHDDRRAILFFDLRPSWASTFVRRAIEGDARFTIASRTATSRSIAASRGAAPQTLNQDLSRYDAIVIGAPEALANADVAGLERYLREAAGTVLLLLERPGAGAHDRLMAVAEWSSRGQPTRIEGGLRATRVLWPARLPDGAEAVAHDSASRPVVWRSPVGSGKLLVSGALDSWRFRDPAMSRFQQFWRETLAAAAQRPATIDVRLSETLLEPGQRTELQVTLRDTTPTTLTAALDSMPLVLSPIGRGQFRARLRAPTQPGTRIVTVRSDNATAETSILIAPTVRRAGRSQAVRLAALAEATGGAVFNEAQWNDLQDQLQRLGPASEQRETWYPMRSAWWIVPFALLLGAEWWWRRRRGWA